MNMKIMELLAILDAESACYREMQRVLAEEAGSLALAKKVQFDTIQLKKEALVVKLHHYEECRQRLVDGLAEAYRVDGPVVTVSKLSPRLPSPHNENLQARATRLRSLIAEVKVKNKHNQLLIQQSLDLVKGSLKLLTDLVYDNSVYPKPGGGSPALGYSGGGGRFLCESA
ncbi:flagellar protein FlgN [Desulfosarcina sp.]|uniref:flagellar protein FlgN n=1 Tax=Desulfosarcina sp. TaxID=2027861 RepID=UPI00397064C5